jgi:DNA gyrase/topoisomerase IV subunit B
MTDRELKEELLEIITCSALNPQVMSQKVQNLYKEAAKELVYKAIEEFSKKLEEDGNKVIDEAIRTLKQGYREENKTNGFMDRLRNSIIMYTLSDKTFIEPLKAAILIKLHGELEKLIKEKL